MAALATAVGVRVPGVTLLVALAAVACTLGLASRPDTWSPAIAWLVHAGPQHLAVDLACWLAVASWVESRAGGGRLAVATALAALAHAAAAARFSPDVPVIGLSAVVYGVGCAGLLPHARRDPGAALALGAIGLVIAAELLTGTNPLAEALGISPRGQWLADPTAPVGRTPQVHAASALGGLVLGAAGGRGTPRRPDKNRNGRTVHPPIP